MRPLTSSEVVPRCKVVGGREEECFVGLESLFPIGLSEKLWWYRCQQKWPGFCFFPQWNRKWLFLHISFFTISIVFFASLPSSSSSISGRFNCKAAKKRLYFHSNVFFSSSLSPHLVHRDIFFVFGPVVEIIVETTNNWLLQAFAGFAGWLAFEQGWRRKWPFAVNAREHFYDLPFPQYASKTTLGTIEFLFICNQVND